MNSNNKLNCSLTGDSHFIKEMFLFKEMNNILICEVNAKVSEKGVWCNPLRCDIEKAIKITPLNTDPSPFYWDNNIKSAAIKIWENINKC